MKNIKLNIQNNTDNHYQISKKKIKIWIHRIIKKKCEITIRIVNILEIKQLNYTYRKQNKPTNILSFPFESIPHIKSQFIGDLIICLEIIKKESQSQQKTIEEHLAHIIIHGTLHLLGYTHDNIYNTKIMQYIEIKNMIKLGYKNPYLPLKY
ncbi:rRNA maturation RNase YbeY [Buchnera aphidicola]|uniref:Endoribonuclease YbeY n=1 Tax=Buchnera aphidicola (Stegophylla sp.) TaxID=2315800 RepID=A0A4D6YJ20_9GAMM|nr:rRNA maturation RNase YbeY [Buchnera aphidicola (Stegophylla sp.)]QCI26431.1 rRNA maturation RNase YbeY [Buchnera aphidicola (Stegophylla sp.)]